MDPPYNMGMEKQAAELIESWGLLAAKGMLVVESAIHTDMDFLEALGFSIIKEKKFKTSQFTFAEKNT
jgi:16S rRNA (guanine966-N2)-methyltransferase